MKKSIIVFNVCLMAGMLFSSCYPEQDVAPIDSPEDNPKVTVTPAGDYSSIQEGQILVYEISVDKMVLHPISFDVVLQEGSAADDHDFVTDGATLEPYSLSTTLEVLVVSDGEEEGSENLAFTVVPDFHWDWQLNPDSGKQPISATITDM